MGGKVGGACSGKESVATAIMRLVLPEPASPTTTTLTTLARPGGTGLAMRRAEPAGTAHQVITIDSMQLRPTLMKYYY